LRFAPYHVSHGPENPNNRDLRHNLGEQQLRRTALSHDGGVREGGTAVNHVECQIVHKPGRMSIQWSAGTAAFEPIHLEGDALTSFQEISRQARATLAAACAGDAAAEGRLAELGRDLFSRCFASGVGPEVALWLRGLPSLESLAITTDSPGRIPFAIFDDPEQPGPWGRRFPLAVGKRVNPLNSFPQIAEPSTLLVVDPSVRGRLDESRQAALHAAEVRPQTAMVSSRLQMLEAIEDSTADVIVILAPIEEGAWQIAGARVSPRDLAMAIAASKSGNSLPLVISAGVGSAAASAAWECFLAAASHELPGIVALETPTPAQSACDIALSLLKSFLDDNLPIAQAARQTRNSIGACGSSLAVFAPPALRVLKDGEPLEPGPTQPLPAEPYHPLRPLEREERALLFGRDDDIVRCAAAFDQANVAGVLIHGAAGVGKASLVRAGLLPFLEDENHGFRVLRDRAEADNPEAETEEPTLALRAGPDLTGSIVQGLSAFAARPFSFTTPTGRTVALDLPAIVRRLVRGDDPPATDTIQADAAGGTPASPATAAIAGVSAADVWHAIEDDSTILARLLDDVTRHLPFELVIPIEHLDDLVAMTSAKRFRGANAATLATLARSPGRFRVVATGRTELLGEVQGLLDEGYSRAGWKDEFLAPLSADGLRDILVGPTLEEPLPYGTESPARKYGFRIDPDDVKLLVEKADPQSEATGVSPVQWLQAVGAELAHQCAARGSSMASRSAVKSLLSSNPIERVFDRIVRRLPVSGKVAKPMRLLLGRLTQRHGSATTRGLVPAETLAQSWKGTARFDDVLVAAAGNGPLLDAQQLLVGGKERVSVSVPSNGLLTLGEPQPVSHAAAKLARSKWIDAMFICIPLAILGMSATYALTKRAASASSGNDTDMKKEYTELVNFAKGMDRDLAMNRLMAYPGMMAQADAALRQGNTLRARQLLAAQQPQPQPGNADIRGFEWFQLWKSINGEDGALLGHAAQPRILAMSADGKRLASGDEGGGVSLWNLDNLKAPLIARLRGASGPVKALAIAPDGSAIAAAGDAGGVVIWAAPKPESSVLDVDKKSTIDVAGGRAAALTFVGGAERLAIAASDKSVAVHNAADGKPVWTAKEHAAPVVSMTTTGETLISTSDSDLIAWTADGKKSASETLPAGFRAAALAGDGKRPEVVIVGANGNGRGAAATWTVGKSLTPLKSIAGPPFTSVAMSPETKTIAVAGDDQVIRLIGESAKSAIPVLGHVSSIRSLASGGGRLASVGYDNAIKIWSLQKQLIPGRIDSGSPIVGLAMDDAERILASAGRDGIVRFWNPATSASIGEVKVGAGLSGVAFSKGKSANLLAASDGNDIRLWDISLDQGKVALKDLPPLKKHARPITYLTFAPDGPPTLASASRDGSVILWNPADGTPTATINLDNDVATVVSLLPSTPMLVITGSEKGVFRGFRGSDGKPALPPVTVHDGPITGYANISKNQLFLAITSSLDQSIRIWGRDLRSRDAEFAAVQFYRAHHQPVTTMARGSGFFATGAADGTVKTWDESLPDERFTYADHRGPVRTVLIGKNNDLLISGGEDGAIVIRRGVPRGTLGPANAADGN
jgi:WD40 repeat protein